MIRMIPARTAFLLIFLPVTAVNSWAQKQPVSAADSVAITRDVAGFSDAFNRHDVQGCVAFFAEESDFTNVSGVAWHGLPGMVQHFTGVLTGVLRKANRTITVKNIRLLTPAIAEVDADWEMTGTIGHDGSVVHSAKGFSMP